MDTILHNVTNTFKDHAWNVQGQTGEYCRFTKKTKEFEILLENNVIDVVVPLKSSETNYKTSFSNSQDASNFLLYHLNYHEN